MRNLVKTTLALSLAVLLTGMASLFDSKAPHSGQQYLAHVSPSISKESSIPATHDGRGGESVVLVSETSESTPEPAVLIPHAREGLHCPVLSEDAYHVVDFTDSSVDGLVSEHLLTLPTGTYRVEAVSHRDTQIDEIMPRGHAREQRWYGEIVDADGILVARTQETRGMVPGEMAREIIADSIVLTAGVYTFVVHYSVDPSEKSPGIIPVCVAFLETGDPGVSTRVEFQ